MTQQLKNKQVEVGYGKEVLGGVVGLRLKTIQTERQLVLDRLVVLLTNSGRSEQ